MEVRSVETLKKGASGGRWLIPNSYGFEGPEARERERNVDEATAASRAEQKGAQD